MPRTPPKDQDIDTPILESAKPSPTEMTDARCLPEIRLIVNAFDELSAKSVFVVADTLAYRGSGAEAIVGPILSRYRTTIFDRFEPNPKLADVQEGIRQFQQAPADVVLAVGGGTAIDIAKLVAAFSPQTHAPRSIILREHPLVEPAVPLIAAPTTSGTGSEATQFAVVYVDGAKHSVDHPSLMPRWCVLDPALTAALPPRITAHTGLDALSQALESLWSVSSTRCSTEYATEAVQLALQHLPEAVSQGTPTTRAAMSRAAHLAGRAINLTRTTAPHAISYTLTSDYGIPHGHAVALTLGAMLVYNSEVTDEDINDPRGVGHVRQTIEHILKLLGCHTPQEGCLRIQQLIQSLGCETRLSELQITDQEALRSVAQKVNTERLSNNPRRLNGDQLLQLLESIR
ncbi:MAG: phosphonoacetaldehyde reductase [Planctomycetota bacterium]